MATLPLRQIEGKYEILAKIKEGGMGTIYKVRHRLLDEVRVVKVMRPQIADSQDLQRRFAREARAAIRLKHPNIAQLYDFAVEPDGIAYMVMEFIDGVTLQEMLARNGPAPLDLTLEVARQGLEALRYLHAGGYVHRDIAPDNLMLTKDFSGQPQVKVIDLGIVKHLEAGGEGLTATGMFLGKVRYSSPEQFSGEKGSVDRRSDLYSFGVMLYELLTGICPLTGDNLSQLVAAHLFHPPKSFTETDPQGRVPEGVRNAVMRSLAKAPADRIGTAEEFLELLKLPAKTQNLAEDLEKTLSTTVNLRAAAESAHPGTTQERLDARFGLVNTPRPAPGLRAADGAPAASPQEQMERLLASAQRLAEERQWEEARLQLYQALAIDPDHQEIRSLLARVEAALKQAVEAEKRRQILVTALETTERCVAEERADDASRELERVRAEHGEDPLLAAMEGRIAQLRQTLSERARQAEIAEQAARIGALLEGEEVESAAEVLSAAVERFGEVAPFGAMQIRLAEVKRRVEQRRLQEEAAARKRQERVRALLGEAAALAERQKFTTAIARAEEAAALEPTSADAAQAVARYRDDEARRLHELERDRAVRAAKAKIEALLKRGQTDAAERELEAAVAALGGDQRLEGLRGGIHSRRRELEARERERERQEAIAAAVAAIEAHVEHERVEEARRALEEASGRLGADPRFEEASQGIERLQQEMAERERRRLEDERRLLEEERRRAEEARARRERAQALLAEAVELSSSSSFADAVARAEEAIALDPENAEAKRALEGYREAEARRLEELRERQALEQAVSRIEALLARENAQLAGRELDAAVSRFGEQERLVSLRSALSSLRRELEARERERERREAIAAAVAAIEAHVEHERIEEARRALEEASGRLGADPRFEEASQGIERLQQEMAERERRRLEEERRRSEEERHRAEERRRREEEQRRRLAKILASARAELAGGRPEQALAQLESGRGEHAASADWQRLHGEVEAELARREAERKRKAAVAAEAQQIARLLDKRKVTRAAKRLDRARAELGADEELLVELGHRIEAARQDAQQRERATGAAKRLASRPWLLAAAGVAVVLVMVVVVWSIVSGRGGTAEEAQVTSDEIPATGVDPELDARGRPMGGVEDDAGPSEPLVASRVAETEIDAERRASAGTDPRSVESAAAPARDRDAEGQPDRASALEGASTDLERGERRGERAEAEPPPAAREPAPAPAPPPPAEASPAGGTEERAASVSRPELRERATGASQERPAEGAAGSREPVPLPVERVPATARPSVAEPPPPPAPTRVAQPERVQAAPQRPAPLPSNDRQEVLEALTRYRAAYQSLDPNAVARVFTGAEVRELRRAFRQYKSLTIDIDLPGCQSAITGATATATCEVTRITDPKAGERLTRSQRETFHLRKGGSGWVVERVQ